MRKLGSLLIVGLSSFVCTSSLYANPVVDHVAAGEVQIQQEAQSLVVNQASQKAIINWKSFNIAAGESTHFQQPAGGIALNRIDASQGVSKIYGHLSATGQIILTNSAGFFFGPSAYVNVGGMVASTAGVSEKNFMHGHYVFDQTSTNPGSITNQGKIIAEENGLIALLGNGVSNEGLIQAQLGTVHLSSGESFEMIYYQNHLFGFSVEGSATKAAANTGTITAHGGVVLISASDAAGILDRVINVDGVIDVKSVKEVNGEIYLEGKGHGEVRVNGILDASSDDSTRGGRVDVSGYNILLDANSKIDVGSNGGAGDVYIGNFLSSSMQVTDSIVMADTASIDASSRLHGYGGNVIIQSDWTLDLRGVISARGGLYLGGGGLVETRTTQDGYVSVSNAKVDVSAVSLFGGQGRWQRDNDFYRYNTLSPLTYGSR